MLTSMEKFQKMINLEPYADRREIPVFPHMLTTYAAFAGMSQAECFGNDNLDNYQKAILKTFEIIGKPDVAMPCNPEEAVFSMQLPARIPGRELDENALYQFIEKPYFEDPEEYKKIYEVGWDRWFFQYVMSIQNPPITDPQQMQMRYAQTGQTFGKVIQFVMQNGMVPAFHTGTYPIYDALSLIRSMIDFTCDIKEDPGPIMDIIQKYQPETDAATIQRMKQNNMNILTIFAMRSSSVFASPDMFDEYVWPTLKEMILRFYNAGILVIIHADADWLPMLHHFTELPKACCHIELDGTTDIFKAYDILQGSQSIRGDVPSTMFAGKNPQDIQEYCEKLITMGMKGGFMLGSGCEIPMNAKPENVKAMIDMVR